MRKPYEDFHILYFQKRIVSAETIRGNTVFWKGHKNSNQYSIFRGLFRISGKANWEQSPLSPNVPQALRVNQGLGGTRSCQNALYTFRLGRSYLTTLCTHTLTSLITGHACLFFSWKKKSILPADFNVIENSVLHASTVGRVDFRSRLFKPNRLLER